MKFSPPLLQGIFLRRYKRFFAEIEWQNKIVLAHVPNTGSLDTAIFPGAPCYFSPSENPERKLKFTLQIILTPENTLVGVNASLPNILVKEILNSLTSCAMKIPDLETHPFSRWSNFSHFRPEFTVSEQSRLDFGLMNYEIPPNERPYKRDLNSSKNKIHFIEIKNVTYIKGNTALFPDSRTPRGQKHLLELIKLIEKGHTAEIVFTVQRDDALFFGPADEIDPTYGQLLRFAISRGLIVTPLVVELTSHSAILSSRLLDINC